jgi:hypothetical protein
MVDIRGFAQGGRNERLVGTTGDERPALTV